MKIINLIILVLLSVSSITCGKKETSIYPKNGGTVRIVTYNVGSFSKYMDNSTFMIAGMLKEADADIVGLNELDSVNTRHMTNQISNLASAMGGWNWHFGRAIGYKNGAYGNGIITPDRILESHTVTLEKGKGSEQRSMAVAETEKFILCTAHLDHKSDEARALQVKIINDWAESQNSEKPILLTGDMNAGPESETLSLLMQSWDVISSTDPTFSSTKPSICIDYIFHLKKSGAIKVLHSDVMTEFSQGGDVTKASDHLPVYVDIEIE